MTIDDASELAEYIQFLHTHIANIRYNHYCVYKGNIHRKWLRYTKKELKDNEKMLTFCQKVYCNYILGSSSIQCGIEYWCFNNMKRCNH
jgi:hypothetical protein